MAEQLEARLPEETFDPRYNIDLAETIAYLELLKDRGFDNSYRVGIATKEIFGAMVDFGSKYDSGQVVLFKESEAKPDTYIVGGFPGDGAENPVLRERLLHETLEKPLKPQRPIDGVPKDYVREVK